MDLTNGLPEAEPSKPDTGWLTQLMPQIEEAGADNKATSPWSDPNTSLSVPKDFLDAVGSTLVGTTLSGAIDATPPSDNAVDRTHDEFSVDRDSIVAQVNYLHKAYTEAKKREAPKEELDAIQKHYSAMADAYNAYVDFHRATTRAYTLRGDRLLAGLPQYSGDLPVGDNGLPRSNLALDAGINHIEGSKISVPLPTPRPK